MKPWLWMTLCLGCLAVAGCRTNTYRTMLEQESRQWEERYYIAQDQLEDCQAMLDANMRRDQDTAGAGERFSSPAVDTTPADLTPPDVQGMSDDHFPTSTPDSLKLKQPGAGNDQGPTSEAPPSPFGRAEPKPSSRPVKPRQLDDPLLPKLPPGPKLPLNPSSDSSEVARIELIGMSRDGFNADGRPGDEGIQFVLQPRDGDGRPIAAAGPVSIVVVDPLPAGKSVRVARWDLTANQTAGYHDRSPQGFHLRLPWPSSEPKHSRLRLFARYTTSDGRTIQAEKTIEVNSPARQAPAGKIAQPPPQRTDPPNRPRVAVKPRRQRPVWSPERR